MLFATPLAALSTLAAAAAIPIVIHLLSRRRFRIVDWAAMRFLLSAQRQSVRRLRLEQWLLLATRCAILLLLGLALAAVTPWAESLWRQLWPGAAIPAAAVAGRTHKVLIIDLTASMSARDAGGIAADRAKSLAAALVRSSAGGDGFSVIALGVTAEAPIPGPADDAGKVVQEVEGLRCTHGAADLSGALQLAEELIRRSPGQFAQREIYVFSDMQRSTWPQATSPAGAWTEGWARLQAATQLFVVDVGRDGIDNLAITDLTLGDPLIVAGMRTVATATIRNASPRLRSGVAVELLIGRASAPPLVVQQQAATIPAGGSAAISFPIQFASPDDYLVQVRVPDDALEFDNQRSLVVSVRDRSPVLLVNGKPAIERREQATGWLSDALNPFTDDVRRPLVPAQPRTIDLAQLADPVAGDPAAYDAVFLCDVPRLTEREVARIQTHLQRGGGLCIGLGPNVDLENYNRLLGRGGANLLPAMLRGRVRAPDQAFFTLAADAESWRRAPLAAFASDHDRAALLGARFREYVRLEPIAGAGVRTNLSFVPPAGMAPEAAKAILSDPLFVECPRHRGRVYLMASTWNTDWTSWPIAPSFPPFVQELYRTLVRPTVRRTSAVGEPLLDWLPVSTPAGDVTVQAPDGRREKGLLTAEPHATRLQFAGADLGGIYRVSLPSARGDLQFAVNAPANGESDLSRISHDELRAATPDEDAQIVSKLEQIRRRPKHAVSATATDMPAEHGGPLARWLVLAAFACVLVESILAWRFGSARAGRAPRSALVPSTIRKLIDFGVKVLAGLVAAGGVLGGLILIHAAWTDDLLGFLPADWRSNIESLFDVPAASPGEGTRWRIQMLPFLSGDSEADRWLVGTLGLVAVALAVWLYRQEGLGRTSKSTATTPMLVLRIALVGLMLAVLGPQLRLLFEREGWPDFVILIDDSASMNHADDYRDDAARARLARWAGVASGEPLRRLPLAQSLVAGQNAAWIDSLVAGRQINLRIYRCSDRAERIADIEGGGGSRSTAIEAIQAMNAVGTASRLGAAVESVLQEYRGSTLGGIVILTDGVTTDGPDLTAAAQQAAQSGVPLYPIGVGDAHEPRDLILHNLQVDDAVHVQDRIVFEARLTARGGLRATSAPVTLFEHAGDQWKPVKRETIALDPTGNPVRVRFAYAPSQPGERRFAIEVSAQPDETDLANNRLERSIFVADAQRTRVLYIEGYPRYEFRFLKTLLERESEATRGNKSIELSVLLADADADYARQDRSALDSLPASRDELYRRYDLIILGDVDPRLPKLGDKHLQWLADFVKEKGGGLLAIAGPQFMPAAYRDTPLADVLPIEPGRDGEGEANEGAEPFRLRLAPLGLSHPMFRLLPDEADNQALWQRMMPLFWSAGPRKLKPAAEVLAIRPGVGEPLAVQQFVGAGRVLYFGFDEAWRWRRRDDERLYNQFWIQTVRFLARSRLSRCDLRLDRQTPYRENEPIRITVRFPDDAPNPAPETAVVVTAECTAPNGETESQSLTLNRMEGSRATYEGVLVRTSVGRHRFRLATPATPVPPTAQAVVLPPPGELDRLQLNQSELERAAVVSRGRYWPLVEAGRIPDELPAMQRVPLHQPRPPYPLWSHPAMFALAVALAGFEWLLRKRSSLL